MKTEKTITATKKINGQPIVSRHCLSQFVDKMTETVVDEASKIYSEKFDITIIDRIKT